MRSPHSNLTLAVVLGLLSATPSFAADKFTSAAGFFSINATTDKSSASISNPSAFSVGYLRTMTDQFEFRINYSLLFADFSGSDLGYGLNVGFHYYPFTSAADQRLSGNGVEATAYEIWRPYGGMIFAQRNFQSIRNSYAGIGVVGGAERYYSRDLNFYGELSYVSLAGSSESTATELQAVFGIVVKL